jgi:hypothetical protein
VVRGKGLFDRSYDFFIIPIERVYTYRMR